VEGRDADVGPRAGTPGGPACLPGECRPGPARRGGPSVSGRSRTPVLRGTAPHHRQM